MKAYLSLFMLIFLGTNIFSQNEKISIQDIDFSNTILLFEEYEPVGKHCEHKSGKAKHCEKEYRLLDNNMEDLKLERNNSLSYLETPYEVISAETLESEKYSDLASFRYFFKYKPTISSNGNSCFSNPGALLIEFSLYDRLENKNYELSLEYAFFICDVQLLVNEINKNIKNASKK